MFDTSPYLVEIYNWVAGFVPALGELVKNLFGFLIGVSMILCVFFFIVIIYTVEQLKRVRKKEEQIYDLKVEPAFEEGAGGDMAMAHRWENAKKFMESSNPNDWKQAIIEADILLDYMLSQMGYRGESVGEKLKRVEAGDMKTLNQAWEAHKVRNSIAHTPSFQLDHHVARETLNLYKVVFEEFYYI